MVMTFRKTKAADKPLILSWLDKTHVKAFYYGDGRQNTLNNIELYAKGINNNGSYSFDHWLALINGNPFAFLITSNVEGPHNPDDDYDKWHVAGKITYTLDLLIGPESYLGKGLATEMITCFIKDCFAQADYFLIDPEKDNIKAIHVYEKAGFQKIAEFIPEHNPKPHVMMRLEINQ